MAKGRQEGMGEESKLTPKLGGTVTLQWKIDAGNQIFLGFVWFFFSSEA